MICETILSLFLGCAEVPPTPNKVEHYKMEKHYDRSRKSNHRNHTKKYKRIKEIHNRCGQASWYGRELAGRLTANGERFKPSGLTAASWHHEFNKRVTVVNPKNGRSVTVRINDRGPARWTGRIIDLSEGAFRKIAALGSGHVQVCLS